HISAHGEALSHYHRARACAERLSLPDQLNVLDQVIGRAHYARNEFPEALDYYGRALQTTTDPACRSALKAAMGAAYANTADEHAFTLLQEALGELDPLTQTRAVASATLWLGRHYAYRGNFAQAL